MENNNKVNEKGRPSKYDEKTVTVGMRVPVSKVDDFKQKAKEILAGYSLYEIADKTISNVLSNETEPIDVEPTNIKSNPSYGCDCVLLKSGTSTEAPIWSYRCKEHKNVK